MKVKMGPYRYNQVNCSIFDKWMDRKYGKSYYSMPRKDYTKADRFIEKLEEVIQSIYNVTINQLLKLRSDKRKIYVKIHKYDTWSMDETLAYIIVPMLKQLKESKHGAPHVDLKDTPKELHPTKEEQEQYKINYEVDEKFFKRWEYVLDEMIFAFEAQYTDWEDKYSSGVFDWKHVPIDKDGNVVSEEEATMYRIEDGPNHTYKLDYKGMQKEQKRINNGLRLFGKYYQNLWD